MSPTYTVEFRVRVRRRRATPVDGMALPLPGGGGRRFGA